MVMGTSGAEAPFNVGSFTQAWEGLLHPLSLLPVPLTSSPAPFSLEINVLQLRGVCHVKPWFLFGIVPDLESLHSSCVESMPGCCFAHHCEKNYARRAALRAECRCHEPWHAAAV